MDQSIFSQDKILFLHQKLDDVLHLWARKSGSGSFHFTVNNGLPNLQFVLDLGMENAVASRPNHRQEEFSHVKVRHRGPARKLKNRERAALHQATLAGAAVAPFKTAEPAKHGASPAKDILLPFTGMILPLRSAAASVALATSSPSSPIPTPSIGSSSAISAAGPVKTAIAAKNVDVSSIKKQLFIEKDKPCTSPSTTLPSPPQNYVKSEEKLWSKLFSTEPPSAKPPLTEPPRPKPPKPKPPNKSPNESFRRKEQERFNILFDSCQ